MSNSLRDALLQSGLPMAKKPPPAKPGGKRKPPRSSAPQRGAEIDLAKAWALRARAETQARDAARREAERLAREKKERRQRLQQLLEGKALDSAAADGVRHYEFHGKIRRVHVTAEQLAGLNAGRLAVVQLRGRFLLVSADVARQAAAIEPGCLALLVEPTDGAGDDEGIPDDLRW